MDALHENLFYKPQILFGVSESKKYIPQKRFLQKCFPFKAFIIS